MNLKKKSVTLRAVSMMAVLAAFLLAALMSALPAVAAEEEEDPKAKDPNMAALPIKLPEPSFSGTPLDYWSEQLEFSFKPRPPFYAPKDAKLVSAGVPVTSSDKTLTPDKLKQIVDGDKKFQEESVVVLKPGVQYVQLDLKEKHELYAIVVWHFHEYERVYFDVIVQVSNDPEFKEGVKTLFNNDHDNSSALGLGKDKEYIDKTEGRLFDAQGVQARYIRLYSNGNSTDDTNTYVEVEVYGKPLKEGA